jgi:ABC-type transporter MlaC component
MFKKFLFLSVILFVVILVSGCGKKEENIEQYQNVEEQAFEEIQTQQDNTKKNQKELEIKQEMEEEIKINAEKILASGADTIDTYEQGSPQDVVLEFYNLYQGDTVNTYDVSLPGIDIKNGEADEFVSKSYYNNVIQEALDKYGVIDSDGTKFLRHDPNLCAQDYGFVLKTDFKNQDNNTALVEVDYLTGDFKIFDYMLKAELIKENGQWKMNDIICKESEEE